MKRTFSRAVAVVLCGLLLCMSVPAQLTFGPQRMRTVAAPTLRNRTRLRTGIATGRPRLSFVGRIGGVAFDGIATPAADLQVSDLTLAYSDTSNDGERLSLTINGEAVAAPIYDWQLIPIAKFAASNYFSCFTLFGDLADPTVQNSVLAREGRVLNYHPAFVDTLMGLRLFQLDNLIISPYSWDLIKNNGAYVLGEGEQAPTNANKRGLEAFAQFKQGSPAFDSYVISDNRRRILFSIKNGQLHITGQPSYYFWRYDTDLLTEQKLKQAIAQEYLSLPALTSQEGLITLLLAEARAYDRQIGDSQILKALGYRPLEELLSTRGDAARRAVLTLQSVNSLKTQLVFLKILKRIQNVAEVRELSDKVSGRTDLLRAINPAVWDASVMLLRYAAFFRYVKAKHPQQWQSFMQQILRAPRPRPYVTTPTILEAAGSSRR